MQKIMIVMLFLFTTLYSSEAHAIFLVKSFHLSAASKAMIQWERIFKSKKKMKRYNLDKLTSSDRTILKEYLINHAIDSDRPTIAGV
jgi:uncharacterized GH25 family protein